MRCMVQEGCKRQKETGGWWVGGPTPKGQVLYANGGGQLGRFIVTPHAACFPLGLPGYHQGSETTPATAVYRTLTLASAQTPNGTLRDRAVTLASAMAGAGQLAATESSRFPVRQRSFSSGCPWYRRLRNTTTGARTGSPCDLPDLVGRHARMGFGGAIRPDNGHVGPAGQSPDRNAGPVRCRHPGWNHCALPASVPGRPPSAP